MLARVALAFALAAVAAPAVAGDGLIYDMTDFWKPRVIAEPDLVHHYPPFTPLTYDIDPLVDPNRRVAFLEYRADDVARRDARVFYEPVDQTLPYDLDRLVGLMPRGARIGATR